MKDFCVFFVENFIVPLKTVNLLNIQTFYFIDTEYEYIETEYSTVCIIKLKIKQNTSVLLQRKSIIYKFSTWQQESV